MPQGARLSSDASGIRTQRSGFKHRTPVPLCGASSQANSGDPGPGRSLVLGTAPARAPPLVALPAPAQGSVPNTMSRVWVSVEPRGFWAVQRYMEPLSSAGTRSSTSSFPSNSALPSKRRLPTRVQVNMGSGKTSFCGSGGGESWVTRGTILPEQEGVRGMVWPGLDTRCHPMGQEWLPGTPAREGFQGRKGCQVHELGLRWALDGEQNLALPHQRPFRLTGWGTEVKGSV